MEKKRQLIYSRRISKREEKKCLKKTIALVALLVAITAGILLFQTGKLLTEKRSLQLKTQNLQEQIDEANKYNKELSDELKKVTSDEYIEAEARKRLGYVYKDEILIRKKD